MLRWLKRFAFLGLSLVILIAGAILWTTWRSLPRIDGTVLVPSLEAPITITRDGHGVPYISAGNEGDAYFALGYVHAQDRLFQMDFMRRLGAGRLAEVLGSRGLGSDRFMRTLGLYGHAQANFTVLDSATQHILERYAAGVNAWLDTRNAPLPPEFQLLQYSPEPWTPADSLVWQKLMSLSLAGNWREELLRTELLQILTPKQVLGLWPDAAATDLSTVSAAQNLALGVVENLRASIDTYAPPTLASNVWALDGQHTASGKPLLASDPHLGFQAPLVWYLATLSWPDGTRTGATTPGVPMFLIGHNGSVAWGITTTHADLQDLFIERLLPDGRYQTPDGPADFETRIEDIAVRFADRVTLTVRSTHHGPVMSDLPNVSAETVAPETVLALSATFLRDDDRTASGIDRLSRARSVDDAREALTLFEGPQQNFVYADVNGGIGYTAAAKVPIRRMGNGTVPVPGHTGAYDWDGWVPYDELPHSLRPASGRLVNANNRPMPLDYPHLIAASFPEDYRAERIEQRLDMLSERKASVEDMASIQVDAQSAMVADMLSLLRQRASPLSPEGQKALVLLASWDGTMDRNRPEPLIFLTWLEEFKRAVLADDLGPSYRSFFGGRIRLLKSILTEQQYWCDNGASLAMETCSHAVSSALDSAMVWLADRPETDGRPMEQWRWGLFHKAHFDHPLFSFIPGLSAITTVEIESDGADHTINRGGFRSVRGRAPFRHGHGAGLRAVFDLADLDQSRFIIALGQSGHPASHQYSDQTRPWRDGDMFALPSGGPKQPKGTLTLEPLSKTP